MAFFELCASSVLTQNEDIWNFHGPLTLNNGKLIWYSGSLWYAIVSNVLIFMIMLYFWVIGKSIVPAEYPAGEFPAGEFPASRIFG